MLKKFLLASLLFLLPLSATAGSDTLETKESLTTTVKKPHTVNLGGYLTIQVVRDGEVVQTVGPIHNTIVNEGETALRDCFGGTGTPTCTDVQNFKYHGLGTSSAAIAETDGGCTTELTTQYTGDVRATGSQTNNGANIYRTVGTNTIDSGGPVSIEEFCLMAAASGASTMWTRILTGTITLQTNDALQTTYDLTIE